MIYLSLGRLELDWGKNSGFTDHSALFQSTDVSPVPYYYASDEDDEIGVENSSKIVVEYKEGLSKPLKHVIDRIDLLGYTVDNCKREFLYLSELNNFNPEEFTFDNLRLGLSDIDINIISCKYGSGYEGFGEFFKRFIYPKIFTSPHQEQSGYIDSGFCQAMENLSSYSILRLLAENNFAAGLPVVWAFKDLEEGGWGKREFFLKSLDRADKFLIVTEGSSDARILKHAFQLLKPHISDFFEYVDMEEGYPFTGTGSLVNFVKGLISISIMNNVVVVFDNDAEGVTGFNRCQELNVPSNMRVIHLPKMEDFTNFRTLGPNGHNRENINGSGVAIECYLDVGGEACVRWKEYKQSIDRYQGALIDKNNYKRSFLSQRMKCDGYDYSKIECVLDAIISKCKEIKENIVLNEFEDDI